jgi:hypothetical protein
MSLLNHESLRIETIITIIIKILLFSLQMHMFYFCHLLMVTSIRFNGIIIVTVIIVTCREVRVKKITRSSSNDWIY